MKKILELIALCSLVSCVTGQVPRMEQKIKVWNGAPENASICRLSSSRLATKIGAPEFYLKAFHQGTRGLECIGTNEEQFKLYACMTFQDLGVLYEYIETLVTKCEKWPK